MKTPVVGVADHHWVGLVRLSVGDILWLVNDVMILVRIIIVLIFRHRAPQRSQALPLIGVSDAGQDVCWFIPGPRMSPSGVNGRLVAPAGTLRRLQFATGSADTNEKYPNQIGLPILVTSIVGHAQPPTECDQ